MRRLLGVLALLLAGCAAAHPTVGVSGEPTLEEKAGQLLLVGFRGRTLEEAGPILRDIRASHLGGVILFSRDVALGSGERNIASPAQVRELTAGLQAAAAVPLFIAADQEGGRVARLNPKYGFPGTLSAQFLGTQNDLALTRAEADKTAATLAAAGVNFNLAPVVDLALNPQNPVIAGLERSYSADPAVVAAHAGEVIAAHRARGILTALKHFPGHGSSTADSHLGVTDVSSTWHEVELVPYRLLIQRGLADSVLTAHIFNSRIDPVYPATLSAAAIDGLLRGRLGFGGVVISDDLQMGAIRSAYGWEETVTAALNAGVDILLVGNNLDYDPEIVPKTVALISRLVAEGKVSPARIDASWRRVMALKARLAQAPPG